MMQEMDEIDRNILGAVKKFSGSQVKDIVAALGGLRANSTIRARLDALEIQGYVLLDRKTERWNIFAFIAPLGNEILEQVRTREQACEKGSSP
jgi:DNA-binding IclR family transcriptional regulator